MADELGVDFLGEIPLQPEVRSAADVGVPIVEADPESPVAQAFSAIAQKVAARTSVQHFFTEEAVA
jgi:ATP-binding protein involved in chromosome partitioning